MVWYCGEMCQREHWLNTHKKDCKYLANKKVLPNARHEEATCLVCIDEAKVGQEEMVKKKNPVLPCTMSNTNMLLMNMDDDIPMIKGMDATVTLAEMTGKFHTKLEATITIMMRILIKMKLTKHVLWQMPPTAAIVGDLYKTLWNLRKDIWQSYKFKKPGPLKGQLSFDAPPKVPSPLIKILEILTVQGHVALLTAGIHDERELSVLKPWDTFLLLLTLFIEGHCNLARHVADCLGVDGIPENIERIRTTSTQFDKMWENVLNVLGEGLVPFTHLVAQGLCDGDPVQQCYMCEEEIIVKGAARFHSNTPDPAVIFDWGVVYKLCCRDPCKVQSYEDSFKRGIDALKKLYESLAPEHQNEKCDYCGRLNQEARGHRCSACLTKVYCDTECQGNDTVHLKECKKGDQRKKKGGNERRKERGRQAIRQIKEHYYSSKNH